MGLQFEWDDNKANINKRKSVHSQSENRLILIGLSKQFNTLVVVHVERRDVLRIISARKATKQEQKFYEEY